MGNVPKGIVKKINTMKKPTFSRAIIAFLMLLLTTFSNAQTYKPFSIRKNVELRGKMLVIGNNILGKDNNPFNSNSTSNENISMQYIDIDGDSNTFSSSSADLLVPNQENGSPTTCYRITYAALYWGAMLQSGSRTNINKVKLKLPPCFPMRVLYCFASLEMLGSFMIC